MRSAAQPFEVCFSDTNAARYHFLLVSCGASVRPVFGFTATATAPCPTAASESPAAFEPSRCAQSPPRATVAWRRIDIDVGPHYAPPAAHADAGPPPCSRVVGGAEVTGKCPAARQPHDTTRSHFPSRVFASRRAHRSINSAAFARLSFCLSARLCNEPI